MENRIPCEVIQDLLPLYVDGLVSEETAEHVNEHVADCERCSASLACLKTDIQNGQQEQQAERQREIDYLKKVKRGNGKKIILSTLAVLAVTFLLIFIKVFVIGSPTEDYMLLYHNVYEKGVLDETETGHYELSIMCPGSAQVICNYKIENLKDGSTKLIVYTAPLPSAFHKSGDKTLRVEFSDIGTMLHAGGVTLKPDGSVISKMANEVFAARNPYIGDVIANGALVRSLNMSSVLQYSATTELQTAAEPYGWTFHFQDNVTNTIYFEEQMQKYACVLLAMTDNLSEVHWTYVVETENGTLEKSSMMSLEQATERAGADIKGFAVSPKKVQELLDVLEILN